MKAAAGNAAAALFAIAVCAASAQAQQSPGPSRSQGTTTTGAIDARYRLPHAVGIAERESKGRATAAEFTPFPKGGGALEVTVMRADKSVAKYRVDANTGETVNVTEQTVEAYLSTVDPAALMRDGFTMARAIEIAEAKVPGGAAIGAEIQSQSGGLSYEVSVLKDGAETDLKVTPDGQAVEN